MSDEYHTPVLLHEALEALSVVPGGKYVDATVGGGGHAREILRLGGEVLGIDRDPMAVKETGRRLADFVKNGKLTLVGANFENLGSVARQADWDQADGVLFDLGLSSGQLARSDRGFSFQSDEPLDMRMDPELAVTAADLVNGLGRKELYELFNRVAQVERARAVAQAIVRARRVRPIKTTKQLVGVVEGVVPRRGRLHPATKVFMALRIAVNGELESLKKALPQAARLLKVGGRLMVISFHEGEDRIVKRFIRDLVVSGRLVEVTKRPIRPKVAEVMANPRSTSARARVAEKR